MKEMLIVQIILLTRKSEVKKNGEWRLVVENDCGLVPIHRVGSNSYSKDAKTVRDSFCEYFNSNEGQVTLQRDMVSVEKC